MNNQHYRQDPERRKEAKRKYNETILKKYGKTGYSKFVKENVIRGYKKEREIMDSLPILTKEEVSNFLKDKREKYQGRSGNRKLKKENLQVYKSLLEHCKEFERFTYGKKLAFLAMIDIANNGFQIQRSMLCECGSILSFDRQTQKWSKYYCKKCLTSPHSSHHYRKKYGQNWLEYWKEYVNKYEHTLVPKGKNETKILNLIESLNNIKIDRKFRVCQFYPDGYCHETNTIYEVYEKFHAFPKHRKFDEMRRHMIQDELKCDFVIIWDNKELNTERHNYVQT